MVREVSPPPYPAREEGFEIPLSRQENERSRKVPMGP